jgi:hypothetical protein
MKLSAYVIATDKGFAPNPFGGFCTLACCKPKIRRNAEVDDIVMATAGHDFERAGSLVYAMKVREVLTFNEYWSDERFASRKPTHATAISRCGDNIWHKEGRRWVLEPNDNHQRDQRRFDTSGENVLIATEFFYFGREAVELPKEFMGLRCNGRGHKNEDNEELIGRFWNWLNEKREGRGRIGYPTAFDERACGATARGGC